MPVPRRHCDWAVGLGAILVLAAIARAAAPAAPADWPHWLGPNGNGISAETGWQTDWAAHPPKVLWKKNVGEGYATVSVVGDRVYTTGWADDKDTVWCLKADTGEEVWKFTYPCETVENPGTRCTPTADGPNLYNLSLQGDLFCLDAATGAKRWQVNLVRQFGAARPRWGFACQPLVLGDRLILAAGQVIALDKKTGELAWKSAADKAAYSSPRAFAVGGKTLLAVLNEPGLLVVSADDGKDVARLPWGAKPLVHVITPVVEGNRIFISSYAAGAALLELGPDGLKPVWQNTNMRNHASNSILFGGYLYGFDGQVDEGRLTCVDFKTGERRWSADAVRAGALMIANGKLLAVTVNGDLVAAEASPESYKQLGLFHVLDSSSRCWTMPILTGGRVFCRNQAGDLVCLTLGGN